MAGNADNGAMFLMLETANTAVNVKRMLSLSSVNDYVEMSSCFFGSMNPSNIFGKFFSLLGHIIFAHKYPISSIKACMS